MAPGLVGRYHYLRPCLHLNLHSLSIPPRGQLHTGFTRREWFPDGGAADFPPYGWTKTSPHRVPTWAWSAVGTPQEFGGHLRDCVTYSPIPSLDEPAQC